MIIRDIIPILALLCALAVSSPAAEPAGRALIGQPVPDAAINGVDGRDMSAATARGHHLLLSFSDVKSKDAGMAFFRTNAARFAKVPGLTLHNVIVPGGVLLAPRGAIISRIRSDAARLEREVRAKLGDAERAEYDRASIRWHVDFDRRYTARFGASPHRVTLVLVDPAGRVLAYEDQVDAAAIDRVLAAAQSRRP